MVPNVTSDVYRSMIFAFAARSVELTAHASFTRRVVKALLLGSDDVMEDSDRYDTYYVFVVY